MVHFTCRPGGAEGMVKEEWTTSGPALRLIPWTPEMEGGDRGYPQQLYSQYRTYLTVTALSIEVVLYTVEYFVGHSVSDSMNKHDQGHS